METDIKRIIEILRDKRSKDFAKRYNPEQLQPGQVIKVKSVEPASIFIIAPLSTMSMVDGFK